MKRFIIRRAIQSCFLLLGLSFISFSLVHLAPGGPEAKFEGNPKISPETLNQLREQYGLNDPIPIQYGKWLLNALQGDLGRSYESLRPVTGEIVRVIPNTLLLVIFGTLLGLLGIPMGVFIANRRGKFIDNFMRILTVAGSAVPHWWLGLLALLAAGRITNQTGIKIIPLPGYNPDSTNFFYLAWQLILPSLLIALTGWLYYSRLTRSQVLDVLSQDYVRTAKAKGLTQSAIARYHVLRNALLPLVTVFGGLLPGIFSGAIIFENIFAIPGIGKLSFDALNAYDYPIVLGALMFSTVLVILGSFLADVLYAVVDPRISYE